MADVSTWRPLSGRGARRERPGERGQGEQRVLSQGVKGRGLCPMARVNDRRRPVGLGGRRRLSARQVFDESLRIRTGSEEDDRKGTRTQARSALIRDMSGRLVARWLGQRRWLMP
jgi:hypothetical protein